MATVYLARDLKHDRPVALKVLRPDLAAVLGGERFLREIRLTAQLQHPHILTLIDSGEADGFLYYVMPTAKAKALGNTLGAKPNPPPEKPFRTPRETPPPSTSRTHAASFIPVSNPRMSIPT